MKRFILAILFLSLFGFSSKASASFNPLPRSLPFTENGVTYTETFSYHIVNSSTQENTTWNFYTTSKDLFVITEGDCWEGYGCSLYFTTTGTGGSFQVAYETFSNGSLIYDYWGYTQYNYSAQLFNSTNYILSYENQIAFSGDVYDSAGTNVIFPANWEGSGFITMDLNVSNSPELGGGVIITPPLGLPYSHCGVNGESECELLDLDYNSQVTLEAQPNSGYAFSHWEINDLAMADVDGSIDVAMSEDKNVVAVFYLKADDFVFPVLANGISDPLLNNTLNPDGNGWHGSDIGELAKYEGHLGQDYSVDSGSSAGQPVYAVANGTIVEIMNDPNYLYGWCDNEDHGWGPVVVIRHENRDGFNTNGSIIPSSCDTELNPTVIYSLYGHLSKTSIQNLQIGQVVHKGDPLGELGTSGTDWSSVINMPAHLHFELKDEAGFLEGSWYVTHPGECPQETSQNCDAEGIGRGYSHSYGFAPHRYSPDEFILNN